MVHYQYFNFNLALYLKLLSARRATAALPRDLWTENLRQYKLLVKFIGMDMELAQNELIF